MMDKVELLSFPDSEALANAAASAWFEAIQGAHGAAKAYCAALSGGRIAKSFFRALTNGSISRGGMPRFVHFFWADERCVPPDDAESSFRFANELLFVPLRIAEANIHRIRGEDNPELAARAAEVELRRLVAANSNNQPALDLIILGMGEDGHVASLFPGEPEAMVSDKAVYRAVMDAPKPPPRRITLGYSAIAAAQELWVLISGAGKEVALRNSLALHGKTPLGRVLRSRALTRIYSDISLN